ncbi:hypothetical protein [Halobacteriovorax sp. RT-2-6]|uniref:hypothetical protein n=1 Tax=unclassified Halobacteriovorax TaxID=2639665 RepID=UPI0039995C3E
MNIFEVTDIVQVKSKAELSMLMLAHFDDQHIVFTGLSCIDLLNANDLKDKYNLLNSRFLLIYQFQNLNDHKRIFYALALSYGQTAQSFGHLFESMTWFEAEVSRNYGVHFYRKTDRIQYEIVSPKAMYYLEKDNHLLDESQLELCSDYFAPLSVTGEEIEVPIRKFDSSISDSKIRFNIDEDHIDDVAFDFDFNKSKSIEKNIEGKGVDEAISLLLDSDLPLKNITSLLALELNEYITSKVNSSAVKIHRMFIYEIFCALENLKCLERVFNRSSFNEVYQILNHQVETLSGLINITDIKTKDDLVKLINTEDRKWVYDVRDRIHDYQDVVTDILATVEGNKFFLNLDNYFNSNLAALGFSLKSMPLQSYGYQYNIKKYEPFYEYNDLAKAEFLALKGTTYELLLIRLKELKNTYSNIIKICEEYPIIRNESDTDTNITKSGIFLATTQVSSGEVSILSYIKEDGMLDRFHLMSPTMANLKYFSKRLKKFALSQIACEWNALGISEEEIIK